VVDPKFISYQIMALSFTLICKRRRYRGYRLSASSIYR